MLSEISIFSALSADELKEVETLTKSIPFQKKSSIFQEGDPSDWLFVVSNGKVKITKLSADGKEIILEVIKAGEVFGAVAVLNGFPYPANAVAMEDSEILKIPRNSLMRLLDRFPDMLYSIMQELGERIKDSHETARNIALEKVGSRIAALLIKMSEQMGQDVPDGRAISIKLTKQDIAEMVGTTVETAIRTMSKFKRQGLIEEREGLIIIKDKAALLK